MEKITIIAAACALAVYFGSTETVNANCTTNVLGLSCGSIEIYKDSEGNNPAGAPAAAEAPAADNSDNSDTDNSGEGDAASR